MADFSIIQKIKVFFDTVISTPFFLFYFIFGLIILYLIIFDIKKNKKISKIAYIISILFLASFFLISYFSTVLKVIDSFIEIILKALYFPNLGIYISMLIIVNLTYLTIMISKKNNKNKVKKIVSSIITILIDFLFIMIIVIISKNKIDITSEVKLYSDSTILTLLQISMALFASLYLLLWLINTYIKFKKFDVKKITNESIFPNMGVYVNNNNTLSNSNIRLIKILDFTKKEDDYN